MVRKAIISLLLILALGSAALAQTTIRYMTFFPEEIEAEVVAAFNRTHPDIVVQMEPAGFGEIFTKLQVALAGGVAPDVVSLNLENYTGFAASGNLLRLDPLMQADAFDLSIYFPAVVDLFRLRGSLYAFPATFSDVVLFYNEDLYSQAGLTGPQSAQSWPEMMDIAKKLTRDLSGDGAADQYGYAVAWWPMYIWLGGGEILDETGARTLINSPEAVAGLQAMVDTWLVEGVAPSPAELAVKGDWDRWAEGTLATFPIGPWGLAPFQETPFDWNAAHHPPIARQATFLFSNPLAITSQSANPQAAWEFLKFATGPEGTQIRQDMGYEISPVRDVATASFGRDMRRPCDMAVFLEATSYAKSPPAIPAWNEVSAAIDEQLNQARAGTISVRNAMDNAAIAVQAILSR